MNHKKTDAYLLLSVMAFIICPILGIFSLYHAIKAKSWEKTNEERNEYELAKSYKWAKITIAAFLLIGLSLFVLCLFLYETRA